MRARIPAAGKKRRHSRAVALALGRVLQHGECGAGYIAGLAARNRAPSVRGFCAVFSQNFRDALSGDSATLTHLALRGGVSPARLISATPTWDGNVGSVWDHVVRKSDFTDRRVMRFCPACLTADVVATPGIIPDAVVVQRTVWSLVAVASCSLHDCALVSTPYPSTMQQDFAAAYRTLRKQAPSLFIPQSLKATAFDKFVHKLIYDPVLDDGYWSGQELYEVTRSCLMIGAAALNGRNFKLTGMSDSAIAAACSKGFELLSSSPSEGLDQVFDRLAAEARRTPRSLPGSTKTFGKLGIWLSQYSEGPEFYKLRGLLADFLVRRKLVRLGERWIFGLPAPKRTYESISTLTAKFGSSERLLRDALLATGHIGEETQSLADSQVFVDVEEVSAFLDTFSERLNKRQMADHLGVDKRCALILVRDGLLQPEILRTAADGKPLRFFSQRQVEEFRRKAFSFARKGRPPEGTCSILAASGIVHRSLPKLIAHLMAGRLKRVWKTSDRIDDLVVDVAEINALLRPPRPAVYSVAECNKMLRISPKNISLMLARGYLPQEIVVRPSGIGSMRAIPAQAVDDWREKHITAVEICERYNIGIRGMVDRFATFGITPALTTEQVGATVFHREQVTEFLSLSGLARYKSSYYVNNRPPARLRNRKRPQLNLAT